MTELATFKTYEGLIDALRARMVAIDLTNAATDELAGLPLGYTGKLLGPAHVKTLGPMSFDALMQTFGVRLALIEDTAATELIRRRITPRERSAPRDASTVSIALIEKVKPALFRKTMKFANAARNSKLSATARWRIARHAALVRWGKLDRGWRNRRRPRERASAPQRPAPLSGDASAVGGLPVDPGGGEPVVDDLARHAGQRGHVGRCRQPRTQQL